MELEIEIVLIKVRRSKDFFTKDSPYKPKTHNKKNKKKLSKEYCRNKGRDIRVEEYYKDKDRGICLDISI
jgi:hypothetical protein